MDQNNSISSEQLAHDLAVASATAIAVSHINRGQHNELMIRQLIDAAYSRAIDDFRSRYPNDKSE